MWSAIFPKGRECSQFFFPQLVGFGTVSEYTSCWACRDVASCAGSECLGRCGRLGGICSIDEESAREHFVGNASPNGFSGATILLFVFEDLTLGSFNWLPLCRPRQIGRLILVGTTFLYGRNLSAQIHYVVAYAGGAA